MWPLEWHCWNFWAWSINYALSTTVIVLTWLMADYLCYHWNFDVDSIYINGSQRYYSCVGTRCKEHDMLWCKHWCVCTTKITVYNSVTKMVICLHQLLTTLYSTAQLASDVLLLCLQWDNLRYPRSWKPECERERDRRAGKYAKNSKLTQSDCSYCQSVIHKFKGHLQIGKIRAITVMLCCALQS